MTLLRKLETTFGIVTIIACAAAIFFEEIPRMTPGFATQQIAGILVLSVPALLVGVGSYLHAVRNNFSGFVLLWIGGTALTLWLVAGVFGGVLYLYGGSGGFIMLSPGLTALVAMIFSLLVRRNNNGE